MPRTLRRDVIFPAEVALYHCVCRVVRRAFLCGDDSISGKNFDHRKVWLENRFQTLARYFGIDIIGYAVMSNHYHIILRSRPDCVAAWSDEEVARRWLSLMAPRLRRKNVNFRDYSDGGALPEPHELEIEMLLNDARTLAVVRQRLSDVSWWMKLTNEPMARISNSEDRCTGSFWESRFKATRLCDDGAILACMAYVDLNPIRAGIAKTPEKSEFTSIQRRIEALEDANSPRKSRKPKINVSGRVIHTKRVRGDRFLAPIELDQRAKPGPTLSTLRSRCSDKGVLPMSLDRYLVLVDAMGRQLRGDKRGAIPKDMAPIFERLDISEEYFVHLVKNFGRLFHAVAGNSDTMKRERVHRGRSYHVRHQKV